MIEAVNATLANAAVIRPQDGGSNPSGQNVKTNTSSGDGGISAPQAPYISPHIEVDVNYDKAVLQIRDSNTGDVVRQFPSESRLQELRREADEAQKPALPSADTRTDDTQTNGKSGGLGGVTPASTSNTQDSDTAALAQAQNAAAALSNPSISAGNSLSSGVSFLA